MQTINCYHYPNSVEVQCNVDPTLKLRNRVMYQRTVKIYKGVDNVIRFTFKNSDQKPVNVTGWAINFNMIADDEGSIVVTKHAVVIDAIAGVVSVKLTALDLLDLNDNMYNYSLSVTDPLGSEQVVYADDNYEVRGQVRLMAGHYPTFKRSVNVSLPTNSNVGTITSTTIAETMSAHHTAQFYFTDFTGTVNVEATLDPLPPNGNTSGNTSLSWSTIASIDYVDQVTSDFENFNGIYSAVRFVIAPTTGTIDKILYRS